MSTNLDSRRLYHEPPLMGRTDEGLKPSAFELAKKNKADLKLVKPGMKAEKKAVEEGAKEKSKHSTVDADKDFASDLRWSVQRKVSARMNAVNDARKEIKRMFKDLDNKEE